MEEIDPFKAVPKENIQEKWRTIVEKEEVHILEEYSRNMSSLIGMHDEFTAFEAT